MYYELARLHLSLQDTFSEPMLSIGHKSVEILDAFYRALHPRYPLALNDLQSFGGNSVADLRLIINGLSGRGRITIEPGTLSIAWLDLVKSEDDLKAAKDYMQTSEDALKEAVPGFEIAQRQFRALMWIECEGGDEAAKAFLQEKGNAAFGFEAGRYAKYDKDFTVQCVLRNDSGEKYAIEVQPSYISEGQLFVQTDFSYTRLEGLEPLADQFERARQEFDHLLQSIGLEARVG